jgi:hypothetical protein
MHVCIGETLGFGVRKPISFYVSAWAQVAMVILFGVLPHSIGDAIGIFLASSRGALCLRA